MTKVFIIAFLYSFMSMTSLFADKTYNCSNKNQERIITVIYKDQIKKVPCEVHYKKNGRDLVLWNSKKLSGFCEEKAENLIQKHSSWGWECTNTSSKLATSKTVVLSEAVATSEASEASEASNETTSPTLVQNYSEQITIQAIDEIKELAFSRALSAVSSLKRQVAGYYSSTNTPPKSFNDLGLKPELIKDNPHVRDLAIGKNGEIYIKGNETLGLSTVIKLKPKAILEGLSLEWKCTTNVKIDDLYLCKFDQNIIFPS